MMKFTTAFVLLFLLPVQALAVDADHQQHIVNFANHICGPTHDQFADFGSACQHIVSSEACAGVASEDLISCDGKDNFFTRTKENLEDPLACLVGSGLSVAGMLKFLGDIAKWSILFMHDGGKTRAQTLATAGELYNSAGTAIKEEYQQTYDSLDFKSVSVVDKVRVFKLMSTDSVKAVRDAIVKLMEQESHKVNCMNNWARVRTQCKFLADFLIPPGAAVFKALKAGGKGVKGMERFEKAVENYKKSVGERAIASKSDELSQSFNELGLSTRQIENLEASMRGLSPEELTSFKNSLDVAKNTLTKRQLKSSIDDWIKEVEQCKK